MEEAEFTEAGEEFDQLCWSNLKKAVGERKEPWTPEKSEVRTGWKCPLVDLAKGLKYLTDNQFGLKMGNNRL